MKAALYDESVTDQEKITLVDEKKAGGNFNECTNNVAAAECSAVNPQTFISKLNSVVKLYKIQKNDYGVTDGSYAILMQIL